MITYAPIIIAALSAFIGALSGVAVVAWWLATKFNHVYTAMANHEIKDIERFAELKLRISDVIIQAQASQIQRYQDGGA